MSRIAPLASARPLLSALVVATLTAMLGGCQALAGRFTPVGASGTTARGTRGTDGADSYGPGRTLLGHDTSAVARPHDLSGRGALPRGDLTTRRQCRADGVPTGWLAVAYEAASVDCPARAALAHDSTATTVVIVRYANAPVATSLDVCVNQRVPSGWTRLSDERPDDVGACPGAARPSDPTTMRIRRDF